MLALSLFDFIKISFLRFSFFNQKLARSVQGAKGYVFESLGAIELL